MIGNVDGLKAKLTKRKEEQIYKKRKLRGIKTDTMFTFILQISKISTGNIYFRIKSNINKNTQY